MLRPDDHQQLNDHANQVANPVTVARTTGLLPAYHHLLPIAAQAVYGKDSSADTDAIRKLQIAERYGSAMVRAGHHITREKVADSDIHDEGFAEDVFR
jgi:hypothetical protein